MAIRVINTVLLVATVVGAVLAYRAGREYRQVLAAYRQLDALVGLPIQDPSKVHVRAIATGEDLCFSWRVYIPPGKNIEWTDNYFSEPWKPNPNGETDLLLQVRLLGNGSVNVVSWDNSGCRSNRIGKPRLSELLRRHGKEIGVDQLGADGVTMLEGDEVVTLLRLTVPDDLQKEVEQAVRPLFQEQFRKGLLLVKIGPAGCLSRWRPSKDG